MTSPEFKALMKRIKFDIPSLAACLEVPYQTVRNYIYGANAIPDHIALAASRLEQRLKAQDLQRAVESEQILNKQFPYGIVSEA